MSSQTNTTEQPTRYCQHCGKQIPPDAAFCPECGQRVTAQEPEKQSQPPAEAAHSNTTAEIPPARSADPVQVSFFDIFKIRKFKQTIAELTAKNAELQAFITPEMREADRLKKHILDLHGEIDAKNTALQDMDGTIAECNQVIARLREEIASLEDKSAKTEKQIQTNSNKINHLKELYRAVTFSIDAYRAQEYSESTVRSPEEELNELYPSVTLHIHSMDMQDLRKAFRENDKQIEAVTAAYQARYTTKANQTIYKLMVIALRAELQNILYDLKYQKLDQGIENVKTVTAKYLAIACEGNQSIAPTMTKFIGEMEYLFVNAVKIEYEYYVKKEQARQEQIAIREQMKQEAAERKALEAERKKIEAEESKYKTEIDEMRAKLDTAAEDAAEALRQRILELESQLSEVVLKKDVIVNLQNGKAGNVYIISNLGSFGENVFKIGMTRRLDPQERVDELGSASVPFEFDVHSFIFSEDAVALENALHERLSAKRVNKVNSRKEFFYATVDELEALTAEIAPTAEFHRTMIAEEYRQSLSVQEENGDI